jgi:RNA polymerase sigma-70 factor, ECF subfamily
MKETTVDLPVLDSVRRARREFLEHLEPLRPQLHRYCRRLTGNVWDAEDLVQDTLARAFARAARTHQPVRNPKAWLIRIATNAYLDSRRRAAPTPVEVPDAADDPQADIGEVRDALTEVTRLLPPQERAAVVLKDVFDLPLAEIAGMLGTTVGAVKAALHRGRGRLADDRPAAAVGRRAPDRAVVDALADAFTAYDLDRLAELFLVDATSEVVGLVHEDGRDQIRAGSLHHTLFLETDVRYRAEVRELDGEPLVVLWATPTDGRGPEAVEDLLRVDTEAGGVRRLRWYYFCPDTLVEVAGRLDLPVRTHGHQL